MKARSWVLFSGFLWFVGGILLMYKGLRFLAEASLLSGQKQITLWMISGLLLGLLKARLVLVKTVRRIVERLLSLPPPIRLKDAYPLSYWVLIGSMIAIGLLFRYLPLPLHLRGTIDVAIGSALMNGAFLYFREKGSMKRTLT